MYSVVAIHHRSEIAIHVLKMLKQQCGVLAVGSDNIDRSIAKAAGVRYIERPNYPLGNKWQEGVNYVIEVLGANHILICGSDDLLTNGWCNEAQILLRDYDMVGSCSRYLYNTSLSMLIRQPFTPKRETEPIGAGRVYSVKFIEKFNHQLFNIDLNKNLDGCSYKKCVAYDARIGYIEKNKVLLVKGLWDQKNPWSKVNQSTAELITESNWLLTNYPESVRVLNALH